MSETFRVPPSQHHLPQGSSMEVEPSSHSLLLCHHLKHRKWHEAHALLQTPMGHSMVVTSRDEFHNTPLHIAIGYQAPEELIETILTLYPHACHMTATDDGWLPLHVAAMWGCSRTVMEALILAHPDGLDQKEGKGRTPRYFATRCKHNQDLLERSTEEWKRIRDVRMTNGASNQKHWLEATHETTKLEGKPRDSTMEDWESNTTMNKRLKVCTEQRI
jgi:Ankyrin repeats (3 copies)